MTRWLGDHHEIRWYPGEALGRRRRVMVCSSSREIAISSEGQPIFLAEDDPKLQSAPQILVGTLFDVTYYAAKVAVETEGFEFAPLRPVLINLASEVFIPVNAGMQLIDFLEEHQFCGRCGAEMVQSTSDRGRVCPSCALASYPRVSPCVIVLITRGDELLLARSPRFIDGMYSTLAGFVEAGESAEHACHREIREEVGVEIDRIQFQGSQSWPFKHSLMLGYRAEWKSGDIKVDGIEIVDAQWFNIEHLPKLPPQASISRGMIDAYLAERRG